MRRSTLASVSNRLAYATVAAFSSFAVMACEDGPNQTYSPAAGGAGQHQNGTQNEGSTVDPASKDYSQKSSGTNKQELCDAPTKAKVWANMVKQPIKPPSIAGGIDLSGGPSWQGLTVEQAETPVRDAQGKVISGLCQGDAQGDRFGDGNQVIQWGDAGELWMHYRVSNRKGSFLVVWPGYLGTIDAKSRDGAHTVTIYVNQQVQYDGQPMNLDWHAPKQAGDWRNVIYDALLATFSPGLPVDPDCTASGRCIQGSFGDVAYFYIPAIGSAIWVANQNASPPTPSIPNRIDQDLAKVAPFAFAAPYLKLDAEGPIANAGKLGSATTPCVLKIGLKYSDFLSTCVQVSGDTAKDKIELNKVLGGLTHNNERFRFDITGVDINFTNSHLAADKITSDKDMPANDDISSRFTVDQSTLGRIANDYAGNDITQVSDRHGAGLVYLEYARLVQEELNRLTGGTHTLGDAACTGNKTDAELIAAKCTGFEGFMTQAPAALVSDPQMKALALGITKGPTGGLGLTGMKPGHHKIAICNNPGAVDGTQSAARNIATCRGVTGDTFPTSFARVLAILGQGKVSNLPLDAQDVRFFFKQWFTGLVKYLKNASNPAATADAIHAQKVSGFNLFFDSVGAGQFELAEYIDRDSVDANTKPTDIVFNADVRNGIMSGYDVSRELYRGELAMYTAMVDHRVVETAPGKQDNALLTNMFGSPLLAGGWKDHTSATDTVHTAYYCATHVGAGRAPVAGCGSDAAPTDASGNMLLDDNGDPLLTRYEGALGTNRTVFALGGNSVVKVISTDANILSAKIRVPLHKNPYDVTSDPPSQGPSLDVLVPWEPKGPTIGFSVALTGTRDKFIEAYQLDLGGTQITANIDYDFLFDPNTHKQLDAITFLAVETTDFLGDVFLCKDATSGDILTARMYSSVSTILDWFATHPGTYGACQMVVRYSPYGNYADYITSLANGVRLGITQGGGFGRVVDVDLFTPGQ